MAKRKIDPTLKAQWARECGRDALEAGDEHDRPLVERLVDPARAHDLVRTQGRVELARLELGGLAPVAEGKRASILRLVKEAFAPAPVPQRP